ILRRYACQIACAGSASPQAKSSRRGEMQIYDNVAGLMRALGTVVAVNDDGSSVTVHDRGALRGELMDTLAWNAAFRENGVKEAAFWLIRAIGEQVGVIPASIHDYYMAAGRGE